MYIIFTLSNVHSIDVDYKLKILNRNKKIKKKMEKEEISILENATCKSNKLWSFTFLVEGEET